MLDLKEERGDAGLEPWRKLQRVLSYQRRAEGGVKGSHCCLPAPPSSWQWEALPREDPESCSFSQVGGGEKKKGESNNKKCKNTTSLFQEDDGEKDLLIYIFKPSSFPTQTHSG